MFTYDQIWAAFDAIAEARGLSISALAKSAGLDATSFNPSKRVSMGGRERWPSTETLSKILKATDMDLRAFADVIDSLEHQESRSEPSARPGRLRRPR
jgi:phage repressor protein C with HTH and peptisase S24 domain